MSVWVEEILFIKTKGTRMPRIRMDLGINRIRVRRIIYVRFKLISKVLKL